MEFSAPSGRQGTRSADCWQLTADEKFAVQAIEGPLIADEMTKADEENSEAQQEALRPPGSFLPCFFERLTFRAGCFG